MFMSALKNVGYFALLVCYRIRATEEVSITMRVRDAESPCTATRNKTACVGCFYGLNVKHNILRRSADLTTCTTSEFVQSDDFTTYGVRVFAQHVLKAAQ